MKIKQDFVTNSSSTSFIMEYESNAKTIGDFIAVYNDWRSEYIEREGWRNEFQEPPLLTSDMVTFIGDRIFAIRDFVPLYSGERDTPPQYIQDLSNNESTASKLLEKAGIVLISFVEKELNDPEGKL